MKLVIPIQKPRNPLVALTKFRRGGQHQQSKRISKRDERKLSQ